MTTTTEFRSIADIMGKSGFLSRLQSLTDSEIIESGHAVFMGLDGKSYDIDIASSDDIAPYRICPKCETPHYIGWVKAPKDVGGDFVCIRCMNESCRKERENNELGIRHHEKEAREQKRAQEKNYLKRFNVPESFWECTLNNYKDHGSFTTALDCTMEAIRFMDAKSLRTFLITGNTGTGKTHLAVGIIRRFAEAGWQNMRFETAAAMLSRFKECYKPQSEISEYDLIRDYAGYNVLVIDDLGVENRTDNNIKLMQQIVDERFSKVTGKLIITSNFTTEVLAKAYGDRMLSRLTGTTGKVLHITAPDFRKEGK